MLNIKDKILTVMNHDNYNPMGYKDMIYLLGLKNKTQKNEFKTAIENLQEEGKIIRSKKGKYSIPDESKFVTGTLQGHPKGFGFVIPDNSIFKNDIYVGPYDLNGALDKDKVMVKLTRKSGKDKRAEGEIIKIIERGHSKIVGTYEHSRNFGFVIPDNDKLCRDIFIPKAQTMDAKDGDKVIVDITVWPDPKRNPEGKIIEILGNQYDPGIDILSIIREYDLPDHFSDEVMAHVNNVPQTVLEEETNNRKDLRNVTMVTIDGIDAKDLDDAVAIVKLENGNYRLSVHIADVSHYVKEGTPLDKEAFTRATSVYLADRVIPMLPRELSNGICSLNANVDRLAFSCQMEIDNNGKVVKYELFKSVININERMTYKDVTAILENNDEEISNRYSNLIEDFKHMKELAMILREKRRLHRGAIDFDFDEAKVILDDKGKPIKIEKYERTISHRIIEEFMLVCNETVAEHMYWSGIPFIYRIHEKPNAEKLRALGQFIYNFGYKLHYNTDIHPKEIQNIISEIKDKPEEQLVSKLMLRAMQQAKYSPENIGHFGLSAKYYTHFTSPIRRYPDLMIHRIISEMIQNNLTDKKINRWDKRMQDITDQCSERERIAEKAERDTDDLKKCQYMSNKINQVYSGNISSVTSFGFFVELENTIEGLVRIQTITDDYYIYDEQHHRYIGENTKKIYKLGDIIEIRVAKVNIALRQIDFELVDKEDESNYND